MNADRKIPLSVAVIAQNEEKNLPGCLESVAFADQTVVVDSGSTDRTLEIARARGCDVFFHEWRGFGVQKQFAIDQCRNDWILVLDADERIPDETRRAIGAIVGGEVQAAEGYSFPRKNFFQGRWIRHMGWWPDPVVRLFRRGQGRMSEVAVHESVIVSGTVERLDVPIVHLTESSLSRILLKIDHYSTLGADEAFRSGRKSSVWGAAFRAALTFWQNYLLRLGILDGRQGFVLSITDAINKFFKYAKLSEMHRNRERADR
jgi:glycosyltransferase involved in cell wall biosynthesis